MMNQGIFKFVRRSFAGIVRTVAERSFAGIVPTVAAVLPLAMGWGGAAFAQQVTVGGNSDVPSESQGGGLAVITVTGQRRSESEPSLPLSVSALGSEELERRNITGLGDLTGGQVPSLRIE